MKGSMREKRPGLLGAAGVRWRRPAVGQAAVPDADVPRHQAPGLGELLDAWLEDIDGQGSWDNQSAAHHTRGRLEEVMKAQVYPGITMNPSVRFGKPCLAGTRIDVATVVGAIGEGDSLEAVQEAYDLSRDQVLAAVRYAGLRRRSPAASRARGLLKLDADSPRRELPHPVSPAPSGDGPRG